MANHRKQKTKWLAALLGLALAFTAAGCGAGGGAPDGGAAAQPQTSPGSAPPGQNAGDAEKRTVYPFTVKDATGREFVFGKAPERIASTSPSETEMLFALGLGDKVVGVSDFCDYPEEAKAKPKLGSITKPNEEALIGTGADLVLAGVSMKLPTVEKLRELQVPLFKVEPKTVDDIMNNLLLMGQIFDRQARAEELVAEMKAERQKVVDAVKDLKPEERKKVFFEFSPGWTVGQGEFLDELIRLAGGINVAGEEQGYVKISEEKVIADNPQVILYPEGIIDDQSKKPMEQLIRERSGWDKIDAVKNGRLAGVDKDLTSRPGPRIMQALTEIAKGIYPELVK